MGRGGGGDKGEGVVIRVCCVGGVGDGGNGRDGKGEGMRWLDVAFCRVSDDFWSGGNRRIWRKG